MYSINNQYPNPIENSPSKLTMSNVKNTVKGKIQTILSLPDKYPKLKIVFDIGIIALSIIAMVSVILTSGLSGPMFFAIVPLIGFTSFGIALLISDTVKNKTVKNIAEKVAALAIPLIILGSGVAFITAGVLAVPASAAFLGTPQFILGTIISGLAIIALKNITIPKLFTKKTQTHIKKNRSITTNKTSKNNASEKTEKIINQRKKNKVNQEKKTFQRKITLIKKGQHKYTVPKDISWKKK